MAQNVVEDHMWLLLNKAELSLAVPGVHFSIESRKCGEEVPASLKVIDQVDQSRRRVAAIMFAGSCIVDCKLTDCEVTSSRAGQMLATTIVRPEVESRQYLNARSRAAGPHSAI
jgi:hypothetical protein